MHHGSQPHQVHEDPKLRSEFQSELTSQGVDLAWPDVQGY
jgi:hypothetical protein